MIDRRQFLKTAIIATAAIPVLGFAKGIAPAAPKNLRIVKEPEIVFMGDEPVWGTSVAEQLEEYHRMIDRAFNVDAVILKGRQLGMSTANEIMFRERFAFGPRIQRRSPWFK